MVRVTWTTIAVLRELWISDWLGRGVYGFDIAQRAKLNTGTVYPILYRLLRDGYLLTWEESESPKTLGRGSRIFYMLSGSGVELCQRSDLELQILQPGLWS